MKKNIATLLRRAAHWLDPQPSDVTGYARKVVDFIPYFDIDQYRELQMNGETEKARIVKGRMRQFAELSAMSCLPENLQMKNMVRLEHNFGTKAQMIDGMLCNPEGLTVVVELKGTWS